MNSFNLTSLTITQLHKSYTVRIAIRDDRMLLVGANGLGKTTVVNMLFFFLSKQWARLLEYEFSDISVTIQGENIVLSRNVISAGLTAPHEQRRALRLLRPYLPAQYVVRLEQDPDWKAWFESDAREPSSLRRVLANMHVPLSAFERILVELRQAHLFEPNLLAEAKPFKRANEILSKLDFSVLYLPTYRRIEKDLKAILPKLEDQIKDYNKVALARFGAARDYIELVEFGMEDVEHQFRRVFLELKDIARAELNNLAGTYLREVIRGEADTYDETALHALNDETISTILNRVEEKTIGESEKSRLKAAIERLKNASPRDVIPPQDRYIAHFFSKLVDIHKSLAAKEESIAGFVEVVNKYLEQKQLIFDDKAYRIYVRLERGSTVEMSKLSSGEKQIVSLFAHLYLGIHSRLCILIDEPELSLSVEWQKRLLPDILASGRCSFLGAVTHSPFVFDNALDEYTVDLRSCIEVLQ